MSSLLEADFDFLIRDGYLGGRVYQIAKEVAALCGLIAVADALSQELAQRSVASGAVAGFLQKPYSVAALAEKIREVLAGPRE